MSDICFHEILTLDDNLIQPWFRLYELSFPPEERILIADIIGLLINKSHGLNMNEHLIAASEDDKLLGIAYWETRPDYNLALLWYLAVEENLRGRGIGASIYNEIISQAEKSSAIALIHEVETIEHQPGDRGREQAERRIEFYRRHGAHLLNGIHYLQSVGPHQPPIPCHIMIRPFQKITPVQAFELSKSIFGDAITRKGSLTLD